MAATRELERRSAGLPPSTWVPARDDLIEIRRAILDHGVVFFHGQSLPPTQQVASWWTTPLTFLFLDGNHTEKVAQHDFATFARHLLPGGLLAVHDVFPDPRDGGQPPWHVVQRALRDAAFTPVGEHGSLRVLERSTSTLSL